ncbi:hypothetical protein EZV62_027568 [Acer yangbiense]|uniref:DUF4283 domain-containing protein n=1 Tax=Acer yangbiense TaxID=1000413 RepID=A0A5C7GU09_9ROSI|nr:hypothetical protein EZV62_027568 [Acer yangbiense]
MNADEVAKLCESLSLKEKEGPLRQLQTSLKDDGRKRLAFRLVGKILSNKLVNREAFMTLIPKIWKIKQGMEIEVVDRNVFSFTFKCVEDRRMVLQGGPWRFDKALLVLVEPTGIGAIQEISFNKAVFWVQILNIPLLCMTKEIDAFLGGMIGEFREIDVSQSGECVGKYLGVRVVINVDEPLLRILRVAVLGDGKESVMLYRDAGSRGTWKSDTGVRARKDVSSIGDIQKGDGSKEKGASISWMVVVEKIPTIPGKGKSKEIVCADRESRLETEGGSVNLGFPKVQDCDARNLGVCFGKEVLFPKEKGGVRPISESLVLSKISLGSEKKKGLNNKGKVQEPNKGTGNMGSGLSISLSVGLSDMEIDRGATACVQTELERKGTGVYFREEDSGRVSGKRASSENVSRVDKRGRLAANSVWCDSRIDSNLRGVITGIRNSFAILQKWYTRQRRDLGKGIKEKQRELQYATTNATSFLEEYKQANGVILGAVKSKKPVQPK